MALLKSRQNLNLIIEIPIPVKTSPKHLISTRLICDYSTIRTAQQVETLSDLDRLQVLGSGNGGKVYQVRHKHTSQLYALKLIRGFNINKINDDHQQLVREIEILRSCTDSCNIVRFHGVFEETFGDIAILMEYMEIGSLDNLAKSKGSFSELVVANIAYQALSGLDYLHGNKIVHRDIKPGDLLVNKGMKVKIGDFGVSKILDTTNACQNTYMGTCAYMSPERFDSSTCCDAFAGDVWSLGITLMELYLGHHPYVKPGDCEVDNWSLMWEICCGDPPCMPEDASKNFKDFIHCCLQKDWTKRWSASQLLSHPFIVKSRS